MKIIPLFISAVLLSGSALAADKSTSLSDARSAVEANLKTPEGKAFDERQGNDFGQNHMAPLRACKAAASSDPTSFWILLKLGKDGNAEELLFYPTTKLTDCARDGLMKEKFLAPPRPDYWVSIYFKVSH